MNFDIFFDEEIRLVPYWNVNFVSIANFASVAVIRLVPYWNVNCQHYTNLQTI